MEELFQWVAVGTLALRPSQMFSNFIGVGFFLGGGEGGDVSTADIEISCVALSGV